MQQPRAIQPSRKKIQKISVLEKSIGKLNFPLYGLIEKLTYRATLQLFFSVISYFLLHSTSPCFSSPRAYKRFLNKKLGLIKVYCDYRKNNFLYFQEIS